MYRYPWQGIEEHLAQKGLTYLHLLVYGSLVNRDSAELTLSKSTIESSRPAVAFGARRIFNYLMPMETDRYGPVHSPEARAALNILPTGLVEDAFNGLIIEVALNDIDSTRGREIGYDLYPVATIEWDRLDGDPMLAYVLHARNSSTTKHTSDEIVPHEVYYSTCRQGARSFGEEFLQLWLETTFLADGVTNMTTWESDNHLGDGH